MPGGAGGATTLESVHEKLVEVGTLPAPSD